MNEAFREELVEIRGAFSLEGTLTLPIGAQEVRPAVLIIPGSGKGNRDGNLPRMRMNLYKDIADSIAKLGFITLRYDKRGTNRSKGNFLETGFWDLVDDSESAVRYLQSRPEVDKDRIIVLGHSEGGLIAPALHARQSLAGLILLASPAEAGQSLLFRQTQQMFQEINKMPGFKGKLLRFMLKIQRAERQNQKIIQKAVQSEKTIIRIYGVIPLNAKYMREQYTYDVTEELARVTCPTLAITGSNDVQVVPDHVKVIADTVRGESEWHIIPQMNHILHKYEKEHSMLNLLKEYKKLLNDPIDQDLLNLLSAWLQRHFRTKSN